jgi:spore maturation protein SpmA
MALNYVWIAFFVIGFIVALYRLIFEGNTDIFKTIVDGTFDTAEIAVMKVALPLTGVMTFFLGLMNIGEKAGAIRFISRIIGPFFSRLFPEVPKNHPASGQMIMNFSANMLGLDNAATPFGLKAMQSLQELNPKKDTASNAQIMFLVLHTSGLTIIPISIMAQRAILKASNPADIFLPCIIGTFITTVAGLIIVAIIQKIKLWDEVIISWLLGISAVFLFLMGYIVRLPPEGVVRFSNIFSNVLLMTIILTFIVGGLVRKVHVFDAFIEGAKGGFETVIKIMTYLVGMLVAISVFRNSGAMNYLVDGMAYLFRSLGMNTDFVPGLPTALMKPFSGSGARGLMIEAMKTYGPDSFVGRLVCIFQGSADTTFYIVALYFGSVGIKKVRYSIWAGLAADLIGVVAAILLAYFFFPHK